MSIKLVDCTLRDGGYYNGWNFSSDLVNDYLNAMSAAGVDVVEIGFRSLINSGFRGAYAYSSDEFLRRLPLADDIDLGVMVNASEIVARDDLDAVLSEFFPTPAGESPVSVVRIACHIHEFTKALPASRWLKEKGYIVGFNLMQVDACSDEELQRLAEEAAKWPLDALYFADSLGCMGAADIGRVIEQLRTNWSGAIGVHTHDNMGQALQNTLFAANNGATWLDATVTGMGRGPGNAKTELLAIEVANMRNQHCNMVPLIRTVRSHFKPLQEEHGWGTNPFYYIAGQYGIHPTYIQAMVSDSRYGEEDILAVVDHLRDEGGRKFSRDTLDSARHFYQGEPSGTWDPASEFSHREVLLLGAGPGVAEHRTGLEDAIRRRKPLVIALNTQSSIDADLIDLRVACHPVRLLADANTHRDLPQPLIVPATMLPANVRHSYREKALRDFGLTIRRGQFEFHKHYAVIPSSLVVGYALAAATSGGAERILMAGFDGYSSDDPRFGEMQDLLHAYDHASGAVELLSITPTNYSIDTSSVYAL